MISLFVGSAVFLAGSYLAVKWLDYKYPWIRYDLRFLGILIGTARMLKKASQRKPVYTMIDKLMDHARGQPDKPFVYYEDEIWTYRKMNDFTNKVARAMRGIDVKFKDKVAIYMHSCPEFIGLWYGIGKTGAATAFLNYNLHGKALLHCLKVAESRILIVGHDSDLVKAVVDVSAELEKEGIKVYVMGESEVKHDFESLEDLLENQPHTEVSLEWRNEMTIFSHFCYVYTSGTTGMPKAALVKHDRALSVAKVLVFAGCTKDDIVYTPLPLYHAAAGMLGVLGTIYLGASIIVRKKFSASKFWEDCRKYDATVVQYIGETMRYICDTPPSLDDKNHSVRVALGNGLRPQVWRKFLDRFGKDIRVTELYSATEMNGGFLNLDNHFGSVGSFSPLIKGIGLFSLIQYDKDKEEVCRNESGRCMEAPDGTPGLFISKITEKTPFDGYFGNKKQTESKILRNVFKEGDAYFNSGDLLRRDPDYHVYFVDRIGDNYRWKGENVSTNEVSDIITEAPGIKEANVYGVELPDHEGRVGMVVVLLEDDVTFDPKAVYDFASDGLARYARPMFIRIKEELELTGTYKQKKVKLVEEGFDPKNTGSDPLYFMDDREKCYVPLTDELYNEIMSGQIRL